MKIKALFVDLGGVLVVNRARKIGEKYQRQDGLTPETTKKVFRFIQTAKRSEQEIESFLRDENIDSSVWKRFLAEFYASETRNDDLIELLNKAKSLGLKIIYTTNNSAKLVNLMRKYQTKRKLLRIQEISLDYILLIMGLQLLELRKN